MRPTPDPILLLHGQPGSPHDWDAIRAVIGGRVRSLAPARPGWDGQSAPLDLTGNVRAAVAKLDAEGVERVTVVGHSLGGAIAAWLAAEHPERVRALVLAAPSANCASLNRLDELLATPFLGSILVTSAFAGMGVALKVKQVRRRVAMRFRLPDAYLEGYANTLLNPVSWHAFVVEQQMLVRELPALEARLSAISAPTTIVAGSADRIVAPSSVRSLATRIPQAELVQLERASHLLLQERPTELAEVIVAAAKGEPTPARRPAAGRGSTHHDSPGSG